MSPGFTRYLPEGHGTSCRPRVSAPTGAVWESVPIDDDASLGYINYIPGFGNHGLEQRSSAIRAVSGRAIAPDIASWHMVPPDRIRRETHSVGCRDVQADGRDGDVLIRSPKESQS